MTPSEKNTHPNHTGKEEGNLPRGRSKVSRVCKPWLWPRGWSPRAPREDATRRGKRATLHPAIPLINTYVDNKMYEKRGLLTCVLGHISVRQKQPESRICWSRMVPSTHRGTGTDYKTAYRVFYHSCETNPRTRVGVHAARGDNVHQDVHRGHLGDWDSGQFWFFPCSFPHCPIPLVIMCSFPPKAIKSYF